MGNQTSLPCCQTAADKYEVALEQKQQVEGLVSKVGSCRLESTSDAEAININGTFATMDPMEVAAELAPKQGLPYQFHVCGPPLPPCDDLRLRTVNALKTAGCVKMDAEAIDAPPDPEIASILKLVQSIFEAPAALVALFDDRRIFIRDAEGAFKRGDFPWRWSFCGWTMASRSDQIMVIPDATKDPRFCRNAMVTSGPGVRFYCGTPLLASNGQRIGTLCFADTKPREFDASRCVVLNNLAELVVRHLEKDIALQLRAHDNVSLAAAYGNLRRTLDCFDHCVALLDTGTAGWRILFVNNPCCKALGMDRDAIQGSYLSRLFTEKNGAMLPTDVHQMSADKGQEFQVDAELSRIVLEELQQHSADIDTAVQQQKAVNGRRFILTFRLASREDLDDGNISIGVPSFIPVEKKTPEALGNDGALTSNEGASHQDQMQRRPDKLYFMLLQDAEKVEAEKAAAQARAAAELKAANGSLALTTAHSSMTSAYSHDKELSQPPESISGLSMGHLLGKGAYGSVYYGTWYGSPVAVKIIDEELHPGAESIVPPIEAILSKELRHPNVVATLRCACRIIGPSGASQLPSSSCAAHTNRRSGVIGTDGSAATFTDDTARMFQAIGMGGCSGSSQSGGVPCVMSTRRDGESGLRSNNSSGVVSDHDHDWLVCGFNTQRAQVGRKFSSSMSTGDSDTVKPNTTEAAVPAGIDRASQVVSIQQAKGDVTDSTARSLFTGLSGGTFNQTGSQSVWSTINLGSAPTGHRRSSLNRQSAGVEPAAAEAPAAVLGTPEGSDDNSEAYDDFDAGRDSNMSPFLLPPVTQQAGGGGACVTGFSGHSGPSCVSERWPQDEVLIRHQTWLVMEYCDRGCLQDAVDRGWLRNSPSHENSGPRMDAVLATAVELASALSFLHSKDIVHGDMSAWNVMLCSSGATAMAGGRNFVAKIADFGLARHMDIRTKIQTRTYGTLTHMPAETLRDGVISKATDVYSMGVLLWQLYTSSRPWGGLLHGQIIVMVVTQGARLQFPAGCPRAYEELAMTCMDSDPGRRPHIESVLEKLEVMRKDMF